MYSSSCCSMLDRMLFLENCFNSLLLNSWFIVSVSFGNTCVVNTSLGLETLDLSTLAHIAKLLWAEELISTKVLLSAASRRWYTDSPYNFFAESLGNFLGSCISSLASLRIGWTKQCTVSMRLKSLYFAGLSLVQLFWPECETSIEAHLKLLDVYF